MNINSKQHQNNWVDIEVQELGTTMEVSVFSKDEALVLLSDIEMVAEDLRDFIKAKTESKAGDS